MKQKPVAWIQIWEGLEGGFKHTVNFERIGDNDIPLYTAPAASSIWESQRIAYEKCGCDTCKKKHTAPRELSDAEIMDACITGGIYDCINDPYVQKDGKYSLDADLIRFAKAILKKAREHE